MDVNVIWCLQIPDDFGGLNVSQLPITIWSIFTFNGFSPCLVGLGSLAFREPAFSSVSVKFKSLFETHRMRIEFCRFHSFFTILIWSMVTLYYFRKLRRQYAVRGCMLWLGWLEFMRGQQEGDGASPELLALCFSLKSDDLGPGILWVYMAFATC